jgi:hypothetical protein
MVVPNAVESSCIPSVRPRGIADPDGAGVAIWHVSEAGSEYLQERVVSRDWHNDATGAAAPSQHRRHTQPEPCVILNTTISASASEAERCAGMQHNTVSFCFYLLIWTALAF